jgi:hypothetical protein
VYYTYLYCFREGKIKHSSAGRELKGKIISNTDSLLYYSTFDIQKARAVTLSSVEGLSAEARPLCFDGAQHDIPLKARARCDSFPWEGEEGVYAQLQVYAGRISPSLPKHIPTAPLPWGGNWK